MSAILFSATRPIFPHCNLPYSRDLYHRAGIFVQHKACLLHSLTGTLRKSAFLAAIALPGIMRAVNVSNLLKSKFLEWKYIRWGYIPTGYTLGDLQMRLSLAEAVEQYLINHPALQSKTKLVLYPLLPEEAIRRKRIQRMHSLDWQLRYLHAFEIVMQHLFRKAGFDDPIQKLRFYTYMYYHGELPSVANVGALTSFFCKPETDWEADCAVYFYLHDAVPML